MPTLVTLLIWIALAGGTAAAAAALYGHYRVLPGWLTGPEICRLADGGCGVLFRSPRSVVLGIPTSALGLLLYVMLAAGLLLSWPSWWLLIMTVPAVAMSVFLGHSLIVNKRECRICWAGHISNGVLFALLLARILA
jgi:uncharacterized membrane protein